MAVTSALPNGFNVPQTNCWDTQSRILNSPTGYWQRIKPFSEMTAKQKQSYLNRHCRRWQHEDTQEDS